MARVKIEAIVDKLDSEMKRALEDAVNAVVRGARVDRNELFRAFSRAVGRKCSTWENVPDNFVEKTCEHCGKDA
jgi:hypothetical protein